MNKQFTASEVRRTAAAIEGKQMLVSSMLRAFADLLEAREKAVPVRQFRVVPKGSTWTDVKDDETWTAVTAHPESYETRILYTHPAPSDAERLAEALRACALNWQEIAAATWRGYSVSASNVDKASANAYMHCAQDIRKALAAHSAQAQPPAASVTDAMVEDGCMAWNKSAGLGYAVADRDCMRAAIEAALAAQENPNG